MATAAARVRSRARRLPSGLKRPPVYALGEAGNDIVIGIDVQKHTPTIEIDDIDLANLADDRRTLATGCNRHMADRSSACGEQTPLGQIEQCETRQDARSGGKIANADHPIAGGIDRKSEQLIAAGVAWPAARTGERFGLSGSAVSQACGVTWRIVRRKQHLAVGRKADRLTATGKIVEPGQRIARGCVVHDRVTQQAG